LIQVNADHAAQAVHCQNERCASPTGKMAAGFNRARTDLEVGVMEKRGDVVALVFPVRKKGTYWVDAVSKKPIDIGPTHWRAWSDGR